MKINYIAQSGFIIETNDGLRLAIDPWISNSLNSIEISQVPKVNYIFVTHDHPDHGLSDAIEISKRDSSIFISSFELANHAHSKGVRDISPGNVGGFYSIEELEVKVVHAEHSSNIGIPVGFMIKVDEKCIYHMGDTGYYAGLEKLAELYPIDILFIPIGSRFTMDPFEASHAVKDLKPKRVIPMHYNTFPQIQQDPYQFKELVEKNESGCKVIVLKPGDTVNVD